MEYRFHFLLGRIRLGSYRNQASEIISLIDAEKSLLFAARYAEQHAPLEAARALLAAGWAAYCKGDAKSAETHFEKAISLDPKLPEAHFQLAKVLMHLNSPGVALVSLRSAIEFDREYALKAISDGDFTPYETSVATLLYQLRQQAALEVERLLNKLEEEKEALERKRAREYFLAEKLDLADFESSIQRAVTLVGENTFFGFLDATKYCLKAEGDLGRLTKSVQEEHFKREEKIKEEAQARLDKAYGALVISLSSLLCCLLGPVGLGLGIYSFVTLTKHDVRGYAYALLAILLGLVTTSLMLYLVVGLMTGTIK